MTTGVSKERASNYKRTKRRYQQKEKKSDKQGMSRKSDKVKSGRVGIGPVTYNHHDIFYEDGYGDQVYMDATRRVLRHRMLEAEVRHKIRNT